MSRLPRIAGAALLLLWARGLAAVGCAADGLSVQHLGTKGAAVPSSHSYLVWLDGRAQALVDAGAGSAVNFAGSGARAADLDVVLLRQLDVVHAADLPAIVQLSLTERRSRPLPIYGPDRSRLMPSTVTFVRTLFDPKRGAYRYLGELLSPLDKNPYKLQPYDVELGRRDPAAFRVGRMRLTATELAAEPMRILAWRIELAGKTLVVSAAHGGARFERFGAAADLLVIDDGADGSEKNARPSPAALGAMAQRAGVKKLALARTPPTPEQGQSLQAALGRVYTGPIVIAEPLGCVVP